jgi:hypothetical protein
VRHNEAGIRTDYAANPRRAEQGWQGPRTLRSYSPGLSGECWLSWLASKSPAGSNTRLCHPGTVSPPLSTHLPTSQISARKDHPWKDMREGRGSHMLQVVTGRRPKSLVAWTKCKGASARNSTGLPRSQPDLAVVGTPGDMGCGRVYPGVLGPGAWVLGSGAWV